MSTDLAGPPMGDETIRSHLHGFLGEIWPARGGGGEIMRKNVCEKSEICAQTRANAHERYMEGRKKNAKRYG